MNTLFPLLAHLDADARATEHAWHGWTIAPVGGGANNLLYRVQSAETGDTYAVKFTVRDARNRAGREFAALRALQAAGLSIAPRALWWSADRYRQPVVVQRWLEGQVLTGPPTPRANSGRIGSFLYLVIQAFCRLRPFLSISLHAILCRYQVMGNYPVCVSNLCTEIS